MRSFVSVDIKSMDSINELQNRIIIEEDWKTDQIRPVERAESSFHHHFLGRYLQRLLIFSKHNCQV